MNGQSKTCNIDASSVKDTVIVQESDTVEAGAELKVSSTCNDPSTVTKSSAEVPKTYTYTYTDNAFTDEDIDNFFSDTPCPGNTEPECSHVSQVERIPPSGIDIKAPCAECGSDAENWVCLTCYKIFCSRYVNQHMLQHTQISMHPIVLSFNDVSMWCYGCDDFVDHCVLNEPRDFVIHAKYGSPTEGL